jgi:hypothetical protein
LCLDRKQKIVFLFWRKEIAVYYQSALPDGGGITQLTSQSELCDDRWLPYCINALKPPLFFESPGNKEQEWHMSEAGCPL